VIVYASAGLGILFRYEYLEKHKFVPTLLSKIDHFQHILHWGFSSGYLVVEHRETVFEQVLVPRTELAGARFDCVFIAEVIRYISLRSPLWVSLDYRQKWDTSSSSHRLCIISRCHSFDWAHMLGLYLQ